MDRPGRESGREAPPRCPWTARNGEQLAVVLAHAPEELGLEQVQELAGVSEIFTVRFDANPLESQLELGPNSSTGACEGGSVTQCRDR